MNALADRRRLNAPMGGTISIPFAKETTPASLPRTRARLPGQIRNTFLKTGLTPSASGSAYLEIKGEHRTSSAELKPGQAGLKLTCAGQIYSIRNRSLGGFMPDASARDLAAHLDTALKGILLAERWPKSGIDVVITVLEGEESTASSYAQTGNSMCEDLNLLSNCITVASAAIADAGIDCVDVATGGVAAIVAGASGTTQLILDPCPLDHQSLERVCVVAYLQSRDEVTEVWAKQEGRSSTAGTSEHADFIALVDGAVEAAKASRQVLMEALKQSTELKLLRY